MTEPRVLIPVKALHLAKTRLALPDAQRHQVARALVEHTLRTVGDVLGAGNVLVSTPDPEVRELADRFGAGSIGDPHGELNRAIRHGLASIPLEAPVLVLVSDLPRLDPSGLVLLLSAVEDFGEPCFVPDLRGTGTTAVHLPPGWRLPTLFGAGSAARFRAAGWTPVRNAPVQVRIDLDTLADLETHGVPVTCSGGDDDASRWGASDDAACGATLGTAPSSG